MTVSSGFAEVPTLAPVPGEGSSGAVIQRSLATLRRHLDMEVAFLSRFRGGRRWFEYVDATEDFCPVAPGESDPLEDTYCARVADGRLPELVRDAAAEPAVADLAATRDLPVGAHVSVPLRRKGGEVLGTLCCFSREPDPDLRDRDLLLVRMFADLVTGHLEFAVEREEWQRDVSGRILRVIEDGGPAIAMQPIVHVPSGTVYGFEALARFPAGEWGVERWFEEAHAVGLGTDLEAASVGSALRALPRLPRSSVLSVNVSAAALASDQVRDLLAGAAAPRLVAELTEHTEVDEYPRLEHWLSRIRRAGARIAIDDAGSGYAGLERILRLAPDVLKLDRQLVLGIADHAGRQAMVEAMVGFSERMGAVLVAEGVETQRELDVLRRLGVEYAQGYHLGRPTLDLDRLS